MLTEVISYSNLTNVDNSKVHSASGKFLPTVFRDHNTTNTHPDAREGCQGRSGQEIKEVKEIRQLGG